MSVPVSVSPLAPAARVGPTLRLLKRPEVEARVALTRTTIYTYIREGQFPRPVTLGVRNVAWLESEVEAWIASRVASRPVTPSAR